MNTRSEKIATTLILSILLAACGSGLSVTDFVDAPKPVTEAPSETAMEAVSRSEVTPLPNVGLTYPIVDTGQGRCYDDNGLEIVCPAEGEAFYGQDAQYSGLTPSYTDNGDGTITDNVTGLMWTKSPDTDGDGNIDATDKLSFGEALASAESFNLGSYTDWRLPTIKELYSLILFDGTDPSGLESSNTTGLIPFINNDYFDFAYGDTNAGERIIDSQYATSTLYVTTTMNGDETMFGVNFADGRIKGYPTGLMPGQSEDKGYFVLYVRGNSNYGENDFVDNGDGTISDLATGLTWMQSDSGTGMNWETALNYCESLDHGNYDDWRLPDIKEMQSIVDYTRSPDTTNSAAIDPLFDVSTITNEEGQTDYPFFWSSTTHANYTNGMNAAYIAFGRSLGYMRNSWMDVHGAGSQRSDPKIGDPADWPTGHGPQGDAIRIYNYVRCVRGGEIHLDLDGDTTGNRTGMNIEADDYSSPQPGGLPGQGIAPAGEPPAEAINACAGLNEGANCTFDTPEGSITGACINVPIQELACVPSGGPPGNQGP